MNVEETGKTVKVRVPFIIEIDPAAWARSNGQIVDENGNFTLDDLRKDVQSYFLTALQGSNELEMADGTIRLA